MFYDKFVRLCAENGEKPSVVAQKIGLNKSASTAWKRGSEPTDATKAKIAEFFSVPISCFDEKEKSAAPEGAALHVETKYDMLSDQDKRFIAEIIEARLKAQSDD